MVAFKEDHIVQQVYGQTKTWSLEAFLEAFNPLEEETPALRNDIYRQLLPLALERYPELSEAARFQVEFLKNLDVNRINIHTYQYVTKVSDTYKWQLEVNPEGLLYTDISGEYGHRGKVYPQGFNDFWFYGPGMPLPELAQRKAVLEQIRGAFANPDHPVAKAHFPLFEYPDFERVSAPHWEVGDSLASDFVILRRYGVDYGRQNFHDGLVFLAFASFEQVLCRRDLAGGILTEEILQEIRGELGDLGMG